MNTEDLIKHTSHPSNPKATASSVKRSAYIRADSFDDRSVLQMALPSSHSVIKVPSTLIPEAQKTIIHRETIPH